MIIVHVEPDGETLTMTNMNTGLKLLNRLGLKRTQALIIRDGKLMTWDEKFNLGDEVTIKKVISAG